MPIPIIPILIGGVALGAFGKGLANSAQEELEEYNDEIDKKSSEMNKMIKNTKASFTRSFNNLSKLREEVYNSTLLDFSNSFGKLKNVEFVKVDFQKGIDLNKNIETTKITSVTRDVNIGDVLGVISGGYLGGFARTWNMLDSIDNAKCILGDLEVDYANSRKECTKIKSVTRYLQSTRSTLKLLKQLADEANLALVETINSYGVDYKKYPSEVKQQVRITYNLVMACNYFVSENILTKGGNPKQSVAKHIKACGNTEKSIQEYISDNNFYLKG